MRIMKKPFKLPAAFLNQLSEFSKGFYLVTINENNEFNTHCEFPDSVTELALINFVEIQSSTIQEIIRQRAIENSLGREDEEED